MSSTEDRVRRIVCEQLGVGEEEVTTSDTLESGYSINTNKLLSFIQTHQKALTRQFQHNIY